MGCIFINRRPKTIDDSICHESICPITDGGEGVHVISNRSSIQKDCCSYVTWISQVERMV